MRSEYELSRGLGEAVVNRERRLQIDGARGLTRFWECWLGWSAVWVMRWWQPEGNPGDR